MPQTIEAPTGAANWVAPTLPPSALASAEGDPCTK